MPNHQPARKARSTDARPIIDKRPVEIQTGSDGRRRPGAAVAPGVSRPTRQAWRAAQSTIVAATASGTSWCIMWPASAMLAISRRRKIEWK